MENPKRKFLKLLSYIKYPVLSEKTVQQRKNQSYVFVVEKSLNKIEIKRLFERLFDIKILAVKTAIIAPKLKKVGKNLGYKPRYKKIILKLADGQIIPNI